MDRFDDGTVWKLVGIIHDPLNFVADADRRRRIVSLLRSRARVASSSSACSSASHAHRPACASNWSIRRENGMRPTGSVSRKTRQTESGEIAWRPILTNNGNITARVVSNAYIGVSH